MSSKILASPQSLNILQPRRLNVNASPAAAGGSSVGASPNPNLVQVGTGGENENHYGLASFSGKELPVSGTPKAVGVLLAEIQGNHGQALFTMSGTKIAKVGIGNPGQGKKGVVTMAKRNARERNRVKQVNQGFQTLRQHIPDSYRMKKMSKVDTLRCALDYIRSLEEVLEEFPGQFQDQGPSGSEEDFSGSSITQHLERICCSATSAQMSGAVDQQQDQSQSFSYSEADEDDQSSSFLQMTNNSEMDTENGACEFKLKLEDTAHYINVISMVPMISQQEPLNLNLDLSSSPISSRPQLPEQIELKPFGIVVDTGI